MELRIHKVSQMASGGSHVTIYEADIELVAGDAQVEILSVHPPDADRVDVEQAKEAIRRGAEQVLRPRGLGAMIRVRRIIIHLTDFKPGRFEQHTAEELRRLLEGDGSSTHRNEQRP